MRKLIWKLYNENRISKEVALELLDKYGDVILSYNEQEYIEELLLASGYTLEQIKEMDEVEKKQLIGWE